MAAFLHGTSPFAALRDLEIQRVFLRPRALRPGPSRTEIQPRETGSSSVNERRNFVIVSRRLYQAYASGAAPPGPGKISSRRFKVSSLSRRVLAAIACLN